MWVRQSMTAAPNFMNKLQHLLQNVWWFQKTIVILQRITKIKKMRNYLLAVSLLAVLTGPVFADNISVETVQLAPGESKEISVSLTNSNEYTAFQFDMVLPEGVTVSSGILDGFAVNLTDRKDDHQLRAAKIADNTYRFLAYSLNNSTISDSKGALVNVTLSAAAELTDGDKTAKIESPVFVKTDAQTTTINDISFSIQVKKEEQETYEQNAEFAFKAASKTGGFYYATYHAAQATWFPADKFEMFTAVVEGYKVNLKGAEAIDGYYKINEGDNVILRSANEKNSYGTKTLPNTNTSIEKLENHLRCCEKDGDVKGSRINYIYKLGVKNSVVGFYRITTGDFKGGQIYINAENLKGDRLDIIINGIDINATAILGIESATEDNNAPIYNMQGIRVKAAQKGIYIQNGKKFVKK